MTSSESRPLFVNFNSTLTTSELLAYNKFQKNLRKRKLWAKIFLHIAISRNTRPSWVLYCEQKYWPFSHVKKSMSVWNLLMHYLLGFEIAGEVRGGPTSLEFNRPCLNQKKVSFTSFLFVWASYTVHYLFKDWRLSKYCMTKYQKVSLDCDRW